MVDRFQRAALVLLVWLAAAGFRGDALAGSLPDGLLPPHPYNYLHPPSNLAASNSPPLSGLRTLPLDYMNSSSWIAFTEDGQAGISAPPMAFSVHAPTTAVLVRLQPVDIPSGLSNGVAADGNAYSITATVQPGNAPARLVKPVTLTLEWPHLPLAIYVYRNGAWSRLCTFDQSVRTTSTIACRASSLGTFLAVRPAPSTPSSSNPIDRVGWLGVGAAVVVVILIVLAALAFVRSRRAAPEDQGASP